MVKGDGPAHNLHFNNPRTVVLALVALVALNLVHTKSRVERVLLEIMSCSQMDAIVARRYVKTSLRLER